MTELSIIIVNYNSLDFISRCIESIKENSLKELKNGEYEIIVIDNASRDGSQEFLKNLDGIIFVPNENNLGFSKANNIGVKKSKGRYVLFLNPDTIIHRNTLSKMVEFMNQNKDVGAATCKVFISESEIDDASHRGFPTPWNSLMYFSGMSKLFPKSRIFNGYNMGWIDLNKTHEIDALAGAFMMVRRVAGEDVGWWDEDYFFYGEDLDFCYMLKKKRWKVYFVAEVSAFHYKGVSGGIKKTSEGITTADLETKILATNSRFQAMKIFYDKHYSSKYPFFVTELVKLAITLKLWRSLRKLKKSS
ncbi:MAG: hypothetical protein A2186_03285 [Candidatus Levybacteria bacterium RIFOXYA1_FULL_41_10]|nr:MAG: Glycosyl transferase family 2 [Candidatus Levybacteria bacterium GW2011_GWA2_36_13]KKR17816.1 MAG: Glycosyl transferase family 2 [Candidatus Levybacteria bacterium GW2011_GWA1_39_32]KKR51551.1 MAG: Glycosyl transferase family 2 [Candidatus Levybacteria bacterium GW2011_GWC1_40_19]KKS02270.1 MAG: Glycosyl transferase family 2 [Candidatus Levybacteria bacterium GW2011_GWB1_41_21]OGH20823.1 MAG: hypothetical protein A2695_01755 [Candidatus Levybacteria bacterium RIFCSPHIGHO2_01_FULL_40_83]